MPGSTGPDSNLYTIPEVQLGDTFNFWRDATNTAIYKLNKLKIYDAVGSGSVGVTYGSTGAWQAFLQPVITDGLTFTQYIRFTSGISSAGIFSSRGVTIDSGTLWIIGGITASGGLTLGGGVVVYRGVSMAGGLTVGTSAYVTGNLQVDNEGTFFVDSTNNRVGVGTVSPANLKLDVRGGITTDYLYSSTGSTFGGTLQVNGGATFASTVDVSGFARFNGGLSAARIYASTGSTFGGTLQVNGGATFASTVDVTGLARFNGGLSAARIYASLGSTFASSVVFVSGLSAGLGTTLNNLFVGGSAAIGSLSVRNDGVFAESGVALHVDGSTRIDPFNPIPNTGAIVPDSTLRMYRDVLSPSIYGGTSLVAGVTTGCLVFVMPKAWSDTMLRMSIKGYNYESGGGAWEIVVGGYNWMGGSQWVNTSQEIRGVAPTTTVRLAHHDTLNRGCLILGPGSWQYPKVYLDSVFATHNNPDGWGAGWTAYYESGNLAGISAGSIRTCSSRGIVGLGNGNYGLGTTFAQFGFDVVGTGRYSSGLTVGGRLDVGGVLDVGGGATLESTLDVTGLARFNGGLSAARIYSSTGSTFGGNVDLLGGLSAARIYASTGSTFGGTLQVNGGATFASTVDVTSIARFNGGLSAARIYASTGSTFGGTLQVNGGATFSNRVDVGGNIRVVGDSALNSTLAVSGASRFVGGVTFENTLRLNTLSATNSVVYLNPEGGAWGGGNVADTGALVLHLPNGVTSPSTALVDSFLSIKIGGIGLYSFPWEIDFAGYHSKSHVGSQGGHWYNHDWTIRGNGFPVGNNNSRGFARLRAGYDMASGRAVIVLGNTDTLWQNGEARIKEVYVSYSNAALWSRGYSFGTYTSLSGFCLATEKEASGAQVGYREKNVRFANTVDVVDGVTVGNYLNVVGSARFSGGLSASAVYASLGSTFASSVGVFGGLTATRIYASTGSTFASNLGVGGNIRVVGGATLESTLDVGGAARISGNLVVDSSTLFVNSSTDRVGIGTSSPGASLDIRGQVFATRYNTTRLSGSGVTSAVIGVRNAGDNFEWGHTNTDPKYANVLGAQAGNGAGFIGLHTVSGWGTNNTYTTRGFTGWVIRNTISETAPQSIFQIGAVVGTSADNQTLSPYLSILPTGNVGIGVVVAGFTLDVTGTGRFTSGVTVGGRLDVGGVLDVGGGATLESTLDVGGAARISGNLVVDSSTLFVNSSTDRVGIGVSSPGSTLDIWGTVRIVNPGTSGGGSNPTSHPLFISNNPGNISAFLGDGSSTSAYRGNSFSSAIRFSGADVAWGDIAYYPQGFTNGFTSGAGHFRFSRAGTTVVPTANAMVSVGDLFSEGQVWAGATGTFAGNAILRGQKSLLFADADSSNWIGFRSPATVASNILWTLPDQDGRNGQVLSTNAGGTLSWKDADGVTGTDKQVQFNRGGTLGATASLVFEYSASAGFSAGTLGVSGGMYSLGNVGIGITPGAISGRIYSNSTAKLEVRGDIRIPSNGFFVNKGMTLPSAVETVIAADENAFIAGTLAVPSGATLTINSGGRLIVM